MPKFNVQHDPEPRLWEVVEVNPAAASRCLMCQKRLDL